MMHKREEKANDLKHTYFYLCVTEIVQYLKYVPEGQYDQQYTPVCDQLENSFVGTESSSDTQDIPQQCCILKISQLGHKLDNVTPSPSVPLLQIGRAHV